MRVYLPARNITDCPITPKRCIFVFCASQQKAAWASPSSHPPLSVYSMGTTMWLTYHLLSEVCVPNHSVRVLREHYDPDIFQISRGLDLPFALWGRLLNQGLANQHAYPFPFLQYLLVFKYLFSFGGSWNYTIYVLRMMSIGPKHKTSRDGCLASPLHRKFTHNIGDHFPR